MPLDSHLPRPSPLVDRAAIAKAHPRVQSSARWFWWIAGLSAINSLVAHFGEGGVSFVIGLAVMQIADAVFREMALVALAFDALVLGFFVFIGAMALRGNLWAFIVGGAVYLADAAVFAFFGDWLPVGFHGYALYCIFIGAHALREALASAKRAASGEVDALPGV